MNRIYLRILGNELDALEYGIEDRQLYFPSVFIEVKADEATQENVLQWSKYYKLNSYRSNKNTLWVHVTNEKAEIYVKLLQDVLSGVQWPELHLKEEVGNLNYKNKNLSFGKKPILMGIVNVTPDSFSDGGLYIDPEKAVVHIKELIEEGAEIIDLGAESSRPGSERISVEEEWERLRPVLKLINEEKLYNKVWISIDTYKSEIARKALELNADIINDISAGNMDNHMMDIVAEAGCPYVMMHMKGTPENMQRNPHYDHVMDEMLDYFERKIEQATKKGIKQIIIDPGIGFGKRIEDNYEIIRRFKEFSQFGYPVLLGASRKSFLWKMLNIEPQNADSSTSFIDLLGILNNAHILRVHNVRLHKELVHVWNWVQTSKAK